MKKNLVLLSQGIVLLFGIIAFVFLLWEPHLEGRNINATIFEIYFKDPFLAFAYIASIPYFVALYQIFKVLGFIRKNKLSLPEAAKSLKIIKYCSLIFIGFVMIAEVIIFLNESDDRAGGVFMGALAIFAASIMALFANKLELKYRT